MRILVSVAKTTLITTVPSEPILSIAAAVALTESFQTYHNALNTLCAELERQNSVLAPGEAGELCCRLLLLLARDKATTDLHGTFVREKPEMDRCYIHAIGLHDFLSTLLGQTRYGFQAQEEEESAEDLRSLCEGLSINFTHFIQYEKTIEELTLDELEHAWFSGAAIQCCHNQPVIDVLIIYYSGPIDEPFNRSDLGVVGIQVKARTKQAYGAVGEGLTVPPILYPSANKSEARKVKHPTIVMLMDLSTEKTFQQNGRMKFLVKRAAEKTISWSGYIADEPENILINVRGCSALQYPVLDRFSEPFGKIFKTMKASQVPGVLGDLEERMMVAMYPIERLSKVQEAEQEKKKKEKAAENRKNKKAANAAKNTKDAKSTKSGRSKARAPKDDIQSEESFPDLTDMREALSSADSE
ncbi:uncharacterized protein STEHIDRAFT_164085 [Stereum hirsutum FP-91666 SS1]|uniref:Uncharacterized protein n=2 Tax=Stereum hirsutum (strain FP-91666) TaxID=721885 RepID=R7RWA3_STEHR|nr:uncharacterized protein STEHIDRAFT_164085 [Stereum hirsutum FP-91666 SS1]EIM79028.1 hypothetical protein STEHIDRAFT_164085 [Stereum hirsutum FP-91666 SS1]